MTLKKTINIFLLIFIVKIAYGKSANDSLPPFYMDKSVWADSLMNKMTVREKIGQLFMAAAYSNKGPEHINEINSLIKEYHIGGLIFFQGDPVTQAELTNQYQEIAKIPLMIAIDAEWGLGMRLDNTINYPYQMTLGAVQDEELIFEMGKAIGYDLNRLGIHVNFAPVVDVNNNPDNPVINYRSFGENKYNVARKGISYAKGLQEQRVIATAKHFPGHGDTDVDSHYNLPVIKHSKERLQEIELYPFRQIIDEGIGGVMIAHLNIPALDSTENLASTLSKPIVTGLLKERLGFKGLIFSDAMNMKAVAGHYPPGIADLKAILAGNDVIEFSENIPKAIQEVTKALESGEFSIEQLNHSVKKILMAKEWLGLNHYEPVELDNLVRALNRPSAKYLKQQLSEAALTILENKDEIIPVQSLESKKIASLSIGKMKNTRFKQTLDLYTKVDHFNLEGNASDQQIASVKDRLTEYDLVLVGLHNIYRMPLNRLGYSSGIIDLIKELSVNHRSVFCLFRNPYLLESLKTLPESKGLIVAYQDTEELESAAAQLIFGGIGASGKLPVSINDMYEFGAGMVINEAIRFKYTFPEEVNINSIKINYQVDSIVNNAIAEKAFPGCQILVAKDRKVIFHKAYGYHTYDSLRPVKTSDLYDYASISKITSALPALMKLYEEGHFELDATLGEYVRFLKRSNKKDLTFRKILAHQAGLIPYINYWKNTLRKSGKYKWFTFKEDSSKRFPIRITDNLYLHRKYKNKIYRAIKKSPVKENPTYVYSGLSFILYPEIIRCIIKKDYETYLKNTLYRPLGAYTVTYNPYRHFTEERLIPTEYDSVFREQLVRGGVHDEAAAMMGGVSANAGLFSTANDLAKIMQMYLQYGEYGGKRYLETETVAEFTRCQYCDHGNRRGLGFDKPLLRDPERGTPAPSASRSSFGHSGFTGTFTWADPENGLLFVFLSNRVYPTRENPMIYKLNVRTNIHQLFYNFLDDAGSLYR